MSRNFRVLEDGKWQWPEWETRELNENQLRIQCPQCHAPAIVAFRRWVRGERPTMGIHRTCPYCWAFNRVPKQYLHLVGRDK